MGYAPDFELYDNVGRDSEQIRSHRTGEPTEADQQRWARRWLRERPATAAAEQTTAAWRQRVADCTTVEQLHEVFRSALRDADEVSERFREMLLDIASWGPDEQGQASTHDRWAHHAVVTTADQLSDLAEDMHFLLGTLAVDLQRAAKHPAPAPPSPAVAPEPPTRSEGRGR
ncbi:hypothetical protein EBN88_00430 [Streptomyces triticirhizae]|uniref:Uncharacterized protein n=1 Tax=Streptomyces triticirhizae TaxID=2483353 RepID=A0A3M2MAC0_9ACTN|nr:hypothetical protein EBN88_00430 [Streptomyces triticirhizae]